MTNRYKNKRLRYAQNQKDDFDISSYSFRWTEQERIALVFLEISAIKNLLYQTPFKGATPVYKQKTVDAYWDELMDRMPEGRKPLDRT